MAVKAANSGIIIIGGGVIKHHICNANMMVSEFILYRKIKYSILSVNYKKKKF